MKPSKNVSRRRSHMKSEELKKLAERSSQIIQTGLSQIENLKAQVQQERGKLSVYVDLLKAAEKEEAEKDGQAPEGAKEEA
jgi:hypothetical protein